MIYTSYYKNVADVGPAYTLIQVSNSKPKWFPWGVWPLPEVYPDFENVKALKDGVMSEDRFSQLYREKLAKLDRTVILNKINEIVSLGDDRDAMLLCWENSDKFCHRHILAEWLGNNIQEW